MALSITHSFVSARPQSPDPSLVSKNEWNAAHLITGANLNQLVYGGAGSTLTQDQNLTWDSSNKQLNTFNAFTDPSNYEKGFIGWISGYFHVGSQQAGTGVARNVRIMSGGLSAWEFNTSGHMLATTDNASDIGASGAN